MKAYEIQEPGLDNLTVVERSEPRPRAGEVLVRIHAVSLNYRDLLVVRRGRPAPQSPLVPLSDGAGEVVGVGDGATRWKVGDRVCPTFFQGWENGALTPQKWHTILSGDLDGTLREYGVFDEKGLVGIPNHLSFEEAATLPCAALTAWNALVVSGNLRPGETVLTLGTGGVSVFALQIAKLLGAKVFVTSSSDEKLAKAEQLGADVTLNYKQVPDWDKKVLRLTGDAGVDHVVEVGGLATLTKSVNAVKMGGHVALIGFVADKGASKPASVLGKAAARLNRVLAEPPAAFNPMSLLGKVVRLQGLAVGSREMFESMNRALEAARLKPVIDRVFEFGEAREALRHLDSGAHFGKVVVRVSTGL